MGAQGFKDKERIPKLKRDLLRLFENVVYVGNYMTKSDRINFGTLAVNCVWECIDLFDVAYSCSDKTKSDKINHLYNRVGSFISLFEIMQRRHVIKEKKNRTDVKSGEVNNPNPASYELGIFTIIGDIDTQVTSWKNKYSNQIKGGKKLDTSAGPAAED